MKIRPEDFGAIVQLDEPPALVHVDQEMARALGVPDQERWVRPRGWLSGPTEVHLLLTERCPLGCPGCYVNATPDGPEPTETEIQHILERLADAGVFHVALGGGESLLREDLFRIGAHARSLGLVPNLTTSGMGLTRRVAEACRVFGQVNLSVDGLGETYRKSRGYDGATVALSALQRLREAGVSCGINMILCAWTWDDLEPTVQAVAAAGAHEVELLRYKPTGRGKDEYEERRLSEAQARNLFPRLQELAERYPSINLKVDCSFVPFLCAAGVDLDALQRFGVIGCEAGNVLSAVRGDGRATACSFIEDGLGTVDDLVDRWDDHPVLLQWRGFTEVAPEPCASCTYQQLCRGGCKAVSAYYGERFAPDPECPRVLEWKRSQPDRQEPHEP